MKKHIINIAIVLVSTLVTLIASEFIFRSILFKEGNLLSSIKKPEYYSDHINNGDDAFYNDNYWKLNYLFNHNYNFSNNHHLLGWMGKFYGNSLDHFDQKNVGNKRPVLLYGDSFAMCVDSVECFEDILNGDTSFATTHHVLNYGVGGYGVDQISILLEETVDRFDKPFVIFSLLTSDMDRSMLTVRDGQKPYYRLEGDSLQLKGVPISLNAKDYFQQNPPEVTSYLWNKFKSSGLFPHQRNEKEVDLYIEQSKALNGAILDKTFTKLKEQQTDFIVLIFHPEHREETDWRLVFLRELCIKNKVPYMCDVDLRTYDNKYSTYEATRYAIKNDGHPTSYSNQLVSNQLKKYILNPNFRNQYSYKESNSTGQPRLIKDFSYYKKLILKSAEWLDTLKRKASTNNISLDSMVSLDAQYMASQEKNIDYYKNQILNNGDWLNEVKEKAISNNISLDSMIFLDAQYMLELGNN